MEDIMSKYEVIKKVVESNKVDDDTKVRYIDTFLKGWLTEEEIKWIWE